MCAYSLLAIIILIGCGTAVAQTRPVDWQPVADGLHFAHFRIRLAHLDEPVRLTLVKLDPSSARLEILDLTSLELKKRFWRRQATSDTRTPYISTLRQISEIGPWQVLINGAYSGSLPIPVHSGLVQIQDQGISPMRKAAGTSGVFCIMKSGSAQILSDTAYEAGECSDALQGGNLLLKDGKSYAPSEANQARRSAQSFIGIDD